MTLFYAVVEGDPLTSGKNSRVLEGVRGSTIQGPDGRSRQQTLLGQKAWCEACQSIGEIIAAPGSPTHLRERFTFDGYNDLEAFDGDLVACKCPKYPKVISVYGRSVWANDYVAGSSTASSSLSGNTAPKGDLQTHSRWFSVRDSSTGELLANHPFVAYVAGVPQQGRTDSGGYANVVADALTEVSIHAVFAAPRRSLNPEKGA